MKGSKFGIGFAFFAGNLQDIFLGGAVGTFSIVKMLIAGLTGLFHGHLYKENVILPGIIVFFSSIGHEVLVILISERLLFNINFWHFLTRYILPGALINAFFAIIIYYFLYQLEYPGGKNHE